MTDIYLSNSDAAAILLVSIPAVSTMLPWAALFKT